MSLIGQKGFNGSQNMNKYKSLLISCEVAHHIVYVLYQKIKIKIYTESGHQSGHHQSPESIQ